MSSSAIAQELSTSPAIPMAAYEIVLSLIVGAGLQLSIASAVVRHRYSWVAMILPITILMPRGQVLERASDLLKTAISVAVLWVGWQPYCLFLRLKPAAGAQKASVGALTP